MVGNAGTDGTFPNSVNLGDDSETSLSGIGRRRFVAAGLASSEWAKSRSL
jgi:hypothetical protein